jgi:hypothetical protein
VNDRTAPSPRHILKWEIIKDWFAQDVTVSTLAAMDASFQDLGNDFADLLFVFRTTGAHAATFQIDYTEDPLGIYVEDIGSRAAVPPVDCAAGKQASARLMDVAELGWRVSAFSSEPGNPATTVNRRILGRRRV